MPNKRFFLISGIIFLSLSLASCGKNGPLERMGHFLKESLLFSIRPQANTQFFAVLKFSTPPLLSSGILQNGKLQVNNLMKGSLLMEQSQMEKELLALSPDIRIIFRYRMVLNGMAIIAPLSLEDKIKQLGTIAYIEKDGPLGRPVTYARELVDVSTGAVSPASDLNEHNSATFLAANKLYEKGITGKGIRVGIIDTGIDYTHTMFGGLGKEQVYNAIDPSAPAPKEFFPSNKIVGGIDLVGTTYDSDSLDFRNHIPHPDANPLDESEHGTHVAGTVAGRGDGIKTYSGVAPDASLYAIKVFGKKGATGDSVVIAGLEYAADPDGDLDPSDHLDVVNLSLGGPYGKPHVLYGEAVKNLVSGGTVVVASAGNSGNEPYITGAPGTVTEAISVAASIDDMDHNWKFRAVKFSSALHPSLLAEAIESSVTRPIKDIENVSGKLIVAGLANSDFSPDILAQLKGQVALIDRGDIGFSDKIKRAAMAGAIGVVIANNVPGEPFVMGGEGHFDIPAIMISQELGDILKADIKNGIDAFIQFKTDEKIEKRELIDTLASFSSRGPRSLDSYLKPDITAPGANIISAKAGSGSEAVKLSGTSMAAPHMSGLMALLKQARPNLNPASLKSCVMGTAKRLNDKSGKLYALSSQGAGRADAWKAANAKLIFDKPSLSLGEQSVARYKTLRSVLTMTNTDALDLNVRVQIYASPALSIIVPSRLLIKAGASQSFEVLAKIDASKIQDSSMELEGRISFLNETSGEEVAQIPLLAVVNRFSQVKAEDLSVHAANVDDAPGAHTELVLQNAGANKGDALIFNLLGEDKRKSMPKQADEIDSSCDFESAGVRVIDKTQNGQKLRVAQFAVKLYHPVTRWQGCEVSVLVDSNDDGVPEQELAGVLGDNLPGFKGKGQKSYLLNATKARELRKNFELKAQQGQKDLKEDYSVAVIDQRPMTVYNHSTLAVLEVDLAQLSVGENGDFRMKLAVIHENAAERESDDYLGPGQGEWMKMNLHGKSLSYTQIPELITLESGATQTIPLIKGEGREFLIVYFPNNRGEFEEQRQDNQSQILHENFKFF